MIDELKAAAVASQKVSNAMSSFVTTITNLKNAQDSYRSAEIALDVALSEERVAIANLERARGKTHMDAFIHRKIEL